MVKAAPKYNKDQDKPQKSSFCEYLVGLLQQEIIPWRKPWQDGQGSPYNPVTGAVYKGGKTLQAEGNGQIAGQHPRAYFRL